jgi:hypothetical protein
MANKCACIRDTYDFDLVQTRCDEILYIDRSTFQEGAEYSSTPSYELYVTFPDGSIKEYSVTKGTPLKLDLGDCPLQGIYTFKAYSCTDSFTKRTAVVCRLYCGWLKAVAKLGQLDIETIRSIRERLDYAVEISSTDFITAAKILDSTSRDLDRINCSCQC